MIFSSSFIGASDLPVFARTVLYRTEKKNPTGGLTHRQTDKIDNPANRRMYGPSVDELTDARTDHQANRRKCGETVDGRTDRPTDGPTHSRARQKPNWRIVG